jgi:hypothetical protein
MPTKPFSPKEYLGDNETKRLQKDFLQGIKSERCSGCWKKENYGLQSVRKYYENQERDLSKITHLELRESNLCNFGCRMCNATDSVIIEREIANNTELLKYFKPKTDHSTTEENWNQILEIVKDLDSLSLTGGEPMIMKRYYELFDYMIEIGKNETIAIRVHTNGSVYNPIFIDKYLKFKKSFLHISIDAVGKVAEYQRYGTNWDIVRTNIFKYLKLPINISLRSSLTAYTILDMSNLADFFIELYKMEKEANLFPFRIHAVVTPQSLNFENLNTGLRIRAYKSISDAIEKLSKYDFFKIYVKELITIQTQILSRPNCNFVSFVNMTKALDKSRNESFEDVFGYKLY